MSLSVFLNKHPHLGIESPSVKSFYTPRGDWKPEAQVVFIGIQEAPAPLPALALYNTLEQLTTPQGTIGKGSTTSQRQIEELGFCLPPAELAKAKTALLNYMSKKRQMN